MIDDVEEALFVHGHFVPYPLVLPFPQVSWPGQDINDFELGPFNCIRGHKR